MKKSGLAAALPPSRKSTRV